MDKKKPLKHYPKKVVTPEKPKRDNYVIFLWIIILIVSIIRYRLVSVPFERDEGEYGYIGDLFLRGVAPFKGAYSMKLPGTSFMYAILMLIFGHTNTGVHTGMVFVNAATMYFFFTAFKKLFNPFIGLATSTIYGFMAVGIPFDGFAAHATQFICFYSSIALLFLANYLQRGKALSVFFCGLMLGMAFLMKQQAVFLIVFAAIILFIYLKTEKKQSFFEIIKKIILLGAGVFIPYLILVLIVLVRGQFSAFWLWTVKYASTYEQVKGWNIIIPLFNSSFLPAWMFYYHIWLLALGGLLALYWAPYNRFQKLFALLYFIACSCVLSAGFYFRQHYFIAILPALGLLSGVFVDVLIKQMKKWIGFLKSPYIPGIVLSIILLLTIYINREYYFEYSPKLVCSLAYWGNPFNEAQDIAKYIHDNSADTDKIAILGSEPEVFFYAHRESASSYLYTYPLVENQPYNEAMQEEMIKEIEKNKPAYFIFCNIIYSWLVQAGSPKTIFTWGEKYARENYVPIGFIDFFNDSGWHFYWYNDISNRQPNPQSTIILFKRKPEQAITAK